MQINVETSNLIFLLNANYKSAGGGIGHFDDCMTPL